MAVENISVGDKYSGYLQIRSVSLRQTRSGDPYMFVKAGDKIGRASCRERV